MAVSISICGERSSIATEWFALLPLPVGIERISGLAAGSSPPRRPTLRMPLACPVLLFRRPTSLPRSRQEAVSSATTQQPR